MILNKSSELILLSSVVPLRHAISLGMQSSLSWSYGFQATSMLPETPETYLALVGVKLSGHAKSGEELRH